MEAILADAAHATLQNYCREIIDVDTALRIDVFVFFAMVTYTATFAKDGLQDSSVRDVGIAE